MEAPLQLAATTPVHANVTIDRRAPERVTLTAAQAEIWIVRVPPKKKTMSIVIEVDRTWREPGRLTTDGRDLGLAVRWRFVNGPLANGVVVR